MFMQVYTWCSFEPPNCFVHALFQEFSMLTCLHLVALMVCVCNISKSFP